MKTYIWKRANRQIAGIRLGGGENKLVECADPNVVNKEQGGIGDDHKPPE